MSYYVSLNLESNELRTEREMDVVRCCDELSIADVWRCASSDLHFDATSSGRKRSERQHFNTVAAAACDQAATSSRRLVSTERLLPDFS
jgi:hypothetical protein